MADEIASGVACACCGETHPLDSMAGLQCHPETRVCRGCVHWLAVSSGALIVTPIFPALDIAASRQFYESAGFEVVAYDDRYVFVIRDGHEVLHLAVGEGFDPAHNAAACYLHTRHVDEWHTAWAAAGLPVGELVDREWGMREFHVFDPSGNLVRVGHNLG